MPLYLIRSGSHGEFEHRFLDEGGMYFSSPELSTNRSLLTELSDFYQLFADTYRNAA